MLILLNAMKICMRKSMTVLGSVRVGALLSSLGLPVSLVKRALAQSFCILFILDIKQFGFQGMRILASS